MTDREKMTQLLWEAWRIAEETCASVPCQDCEGRNAHSSRCMTVLAVDHLLANGVTFATDTNVGSKWISVEDRLPEEEFEEFTEQMDWDVYPCLCTVKNHVSGIRYVAKLFYDGSNFVDDEFVRYTSSVTHWMPLPKPPKED